jgi:hypothetical protein
LRAFFREFLELFFPEVAARLDFARVVFLDKEVFTDVPEGSRRELDLVAQVYTQEGTPELILLHIEVQAQREREFPYRMFEYYALLRLRYKVPVFPVAVYLVAGIDGLSDEARKSLLINIIETYMRLSETEEEEFRRLIRQEELQEVTHMLTIYEERGIIKGKRDALLKQLRFKFGDVPEAVAAKVQAIDTEAALDALLERVLQATTLADMGL